MRLLKYQSLGNDYFILDPQQGNPLPTSEDIQLLCHRHFGFGSDGILYGPLNTENFSLKIFNPDATEAEKSGNGLRIFARYLWDIGLIKGQTPTLISTRGGDVRVTVYEAGAEVSVEMGQVSFCSSANRIPGPKRELLLEEIELPGQKLKISIANIGNPHCTIFTDAPPNEALARALGPLLENNLLFPNKTNVQFAYVKNPNEIYLEIWERGAGYTLASGSSASAAAAIAYRLGYVEPTLQAQMPGGTLTLSITKDFFVTQKGPVASIGQCEWSKP